MSWRTDIKKCKEHTLARDRDGYARTSYKGVLTMLHRRVYCVEHGLELAAITGLVVRHTCDNPACIEPTHLLIGTRGDNNRDRAERGRSADTRGEKHPLHRLTAKDVRAIRKKAATGKHTHTALAAQYGCTQGNVSRIVNRTAWRHI